MDLDALGLWIPRVETELARSYRDATHGVPGVVAEGVESLREFTLRGGKRFRALLVLAGYYVATHRSPGPAVPAAAALEHFQSWMLVHDDIIDHAETRRDGPTLHRVYERRHSEQAWAGRSPEFGVANAITLGDLEEPFTVASFLRSRAPDRRRLAALGEYARMARETAFGQLLDVRLAALPVGEVREADVLAVHRGKSAVYTVAAPLAIGAALGGGSEGMRRDLDRFGIDVGVAFQLRDDVLGAGLGPGAPGKSANDFAEGKRTLLVVKAWKSLGSKGRAELESALGRPDLGEEAWDRVRDLIRSSGSLDYSEARIRQLVNRAMGRLRRSRHLGEADRRLLESVARRLVNRTV